MRETNSEQAAEAWGGNKGRADQHRARQRYSESS